MSDVPFLGKVGWREDTLVVLAPFSLCHPERWRESLYWDIYPLASSKV